MTGLKALDLLSCKGALGELGLAAVTAMTVEEEAERAAGKARLGWITLCTPGILTLHGPPKVVLGKWGLAAAAAEAGGAAGRARVGRRIPYIQGILTQHHFPPPEGELGG